MLSAYVFLAPAIVAGAVTLGVMQQIIRAFGRVEGSMQYILKAWPTIIELASVYKRLREFEYKIKQEEIIGNNIEIHKSKTNFIRNITLNKYDFQNTFKNSEIDIKNQNITNFNNQMIFKNSCYSLKPISINGFEILTWVKN